jgi:hypothetical protein
MDNDFKFFYCCPDDPWMMPREWGPPSSLKREWLDAIHKLMTVAKGCGLRSGARIKLKDFECYILDACGMSLCMIGWGLAYDSFKVDDERVDRIWLKTSPMVLGKLEQNGRDENERIIAERDAREEAEAEESRRIEQEQAEALAQ